jgi:primosomal protein N' (replication factor Y)
LTRVCRVLPDVTAVDRAFDYRIDHDAPVGTVVRVSLHGRRVRGWIVAVDVEPEADTLLPVLAVVSAGPPPEVVGLTAWVAHRWAGPRVAVLRSASPPNLVPPTVWSGSGHQRSPGDQTTEKVVRWPPLLDRRQLVAGMCASEGSTIVCVADAGRARTLAAFLGRSHAHVALIHSTQTAAMRTEAWKRAAAGDCVVVGGRIAALAPVPDLQAAVVVDDADEALQEERAPTWHARDVLRERAVRAGASFTVCSPAPTVETVFAAGDAVEVPPPDVERGGWPRVQVVDRREEPPGAGLLSEALADALHHTAGPAVCVLNRRGRFRLLVCTSCRELLRWDATAERPAVCPECGAAQLRVLRAGVRRVRDELTALMPGKRVVDVDAATTEVPDADIVIGTEAALHRTEIRRRRPALVAYLDLDQELLAPRYRATSQAHWLVTRGAQLLASRPRAETLLLLQTRVPDHAVVQAIARAEPQRILEVEADSRRTLGYPPFGALAELSGDDAPLTAAIDTLRALDVQSAGVQVFGPDDHRALVTAPTWDALADALARSLPAGRAVGRVRAAVDPPRI